MADLGAETEGPDKLLILAPVGTEDLAGTDPNNPDSDNDGLLDGVEVNDTLTDPNDNDTDDDIIPLYNPKIFLESYKNLTMSNEP